MNQHDPNDELLAELAAELPALDLDDLGAERIRVAARAALSATTPALSPFRRRYRAAEPILALAVAAMSLYWVFEPLVLHAR